MFSQHSGASSRPGKIACAPTGAKPQGVWRNRRHSEIWHLDAGLDAVEHRDELYRALATLNEDEREALALRFGADLKLRDVASVLGEGESAVEGRIYRALGKLRENLQ